MSHDVYSLPANLPVPEDDGAADQLVGLELPDLTLASSQGDVNVRNFTVVYVYPRSGKPGVPLLPGWDETPGARGCTAVAARARSASLRFPLAVARTPAKPSSAPDEESDCTPATLPRRGARVADVRDVRVKVLYPASLPDANADDVLRWLRSR